MTNINKNNSEESKNSGTLSSLSSKKKNENKLESSRNSSLDNAISETKRLLAEDDRSPKQNRPSYKAGVKGNEREIKKRISWGRRRFFGVRRGLTVAIVIAGILALSLFAALFLIFRRQKSSFLLEPDASEYNSSTGELEKCSKNGVSKWGWCFCNLGYAGATCQDEDGAEKKETQFALTQPQVTNNTRVAVFCDTRESLACVSTLAALNSISSPSVAATSANSNAVTQAIEIHKYTIDSNSKSNDNAGSEIYEIAVAKRLHALIFTSDIPKQAANFGNKNTQFVSKARKLGARCISTRNIVAVNTALEFDFKIQVKPQNKRNIDLFWKLDDSKESDLQKRLVRELVQTARTEYSSAEEACRLDSVSQKSSIGLVITYGLDNKLSEINDTLNSLPSDIDRARVIIAAQIPSLLADSRNRTARLHLLNALKSKWRLFQSEIPLKQVAVKSVFKINSRHVARVRAGTVIKENMISVCRRVLNRNRNIAVLRVHAGLSFFSRQLLTNSSLTRDVYEDYFDSKHNPDSLNDDLFLNEAQRLGLRVENLERMAGDEGKSCDNASSTCKKGKDESSNSSGIHEVEIKTDNSNAENSETVSNYWQEF